MRRLAALVLDRAGNQLQKFQPHPLLLLILLWLLLCSGCCSALATALLRLSFCSGCCFAAGVALLCFCF